MTGDPCVDKNWEGVTCTTIDSVEYVTSIVLENKGLGGKLCVYFTYSICRFCI